MRGVKECRTYCQNKVFNTCSTGDRSCCHTKSVRQCLPPSYSRYRCYTRCSGGLRSESAWGGGAQNLFNLIRSRIHNTWSTTLYFCTDIDFIMFWYEVFYFSFFLFVTVLCAQAHGISDSMWQMYRPLAYKDVWSIIPMLLRYQNIPWYFDFLRLQCCYSTVPTRAVDNFLLIRI